MAVALDNMAAKVNDIIECSICFETFTDPKVLPCIHTFCLQCLKNVCADKRSSAGVMCPFCRKVFTIPEGGLEHLPNNYLINELLQVNHQQQQQQLLIAETEKFREQLKLDIQNVASCGLQSRETLKIIKRAKTDLIKKVSATETQISQKYDQLVDVIRLRRSQLIEELNSFKDRRLKEMENVKKEAEKQVALMDSFTKECLKIKDNETACEILSTASRLKLHAQAVDLIKTSDAFNGFDLKITDVTFQPSCMMTSDNVKSIIGALVFKEITENITEKSRKDEILSEDVNLASLLKHPTLHRIISEKGSIRGVAVFLDKLYVVRGAGQIDTYNNKCLTFIKHLEIADSKSLVAIVACLQNRCLYVSDAGQRIVYRFDLRSNNVIKQWPVDKKCEGLSVTKSYNLLVSLQTDNRVNEYNSDGILMRVIKFNSLDGPYHCIELSIDKFLVSHHGAKQSGVCIVDGSGCVVKSSGMLGGGISGPRHMVVDKYGNVLVADCNNDRVELLSSDLTHLGYVEIQGQKLNGPHALCVDAESRRLYIGEYWGVRLLVINF